MSCVLKAHMFYRALKYLMCFRFYRAQFVHSIKIINKILFCLLLIDQASGNDRILFLG